MSKKIVKKATKKSAGKPTTFVTVRKIPPVVSDLQKAKDAYEAKLQGVIDSHKPGTQLQIELEAAIHCHKCNHQVQVDDLFCEQCGVPLIDKCKTCGIEKARKDPCPICPKAS